MAWEFAEEFSIRIVSPDSLVFITTSTSHKVSLRVVGLGPAPSALNPKSYTFNLES